MWLYPERRNHFGIFKWGLAWINGGKNKCFEFFDVLEEKISCSCKLVGLSGMKFPVLNRVGVADGTNSIPLLYTLCLSRNPKGGMRGFHS